jgi:predicted phosphoribosyltransferase
MKRRRALYSPGRPAIEARGRVCIVVDDGLATGATLIAALQALRTRGPARLVCAAPVASRESLAHIGKLADEVVCLSVPPEFRAVGQFYGEFNPVSDAEVVRILQEEHAIDANHAA